MNQEMWDKLVTLVGEEAAEEIREIYNRHGKTTREGLEELLEFCPKNRLIGRAEAKGGELVFGAPLGGRWEVNSVEGTLVYNHDSGEKKKWSLSQLS